MPLYEDKWRFEDNCWRLYFDPITWFDSDYLPIPRDHPAEISIGFEDFTVTLPDELLMNILNRAMEDTFFTSKHSLPESGPKLLTRNMGEEVTYEAVMPDLPTEGHRYEEIPNWSAALLCCRRWHRIGFFTAKMQKELDYKLYRVARYPYDFEEFRFTLPLDRPKMFLAYINDLYLGIHGSKEEKMAVTLERFIEILPVMTALERLNMYVTSDGIGPRQEEAVHLFEALPVTVTSFRLDTNKSDIGTSESFIALSVCVVALVQRIKHVTIRMKNFEVYTDSCEDCRQGLECYGPTA